MKTPQCLKIFLVLSACCSCPWTVAQADETIIDNLGPGTSKTGSWTNSTQWGYAGDREISTQAGATYLFEAAVSGTTEVSMTWSPNSGRCSAVPVQVYNGDQLIDTFSVNQQGNGVAWKEQRSYQFSGTAKVQINSNGGCSTCADAVRFVWDGTPPPLAQCADGIDNDGDGLVDYPNDPGCTSASGTSEVNAPATGRTVDAVPIWEITQQGTSMSVNWVDYPLNPRFAIHEGPAGLPETDAVLDKETRLVWSRSLSFVKYSYPMAVLASQDSGILGRGGARIPSCTELQSLYKAVEASPGFYDAGFVLPEDIPFLFDEQIDECNAAPDTCWEVDVWCVSPSTACPEASNFPTSACPFILTLIHLEAPEYTGFSSESSPGEMAYVILVRGGK